MSKFWDDLSKQHEYTLELQGYDKYRGHVARRYSTDARLENDASIGELYNRLNIDDVIEDSGDGDALMININNKKVSQDSINTTYELYCLKPIMHVTTSVLEIGAGYGRTAYGMLTRYPKLDYTIIDREPALSVARKFLTKQFPHAKLTFLTEWDKKPRELALCISVLTELDFEELVKYRRILNTCRHVFIRDWESWTNPVDGITVTKKDIINHEWKKMFEGNDRLMLGFFNGLYQV